MACIALVYALYGDMDGAEAAAQSALAARLAACVNILSPCTSLYRWNDVLQREAEVPALFKTSLSARDRLIAHLGSTHEYDIPAISHWEVGTTSVYRDWVEAECGGEAIL